MSVHNKRAAAIAGFASELLFEEKKRRWSKQWLQNRDKSDFLLLMELRTEEPSDFKNYLRMCPDTFTELLHLVGPQIQKQNTKMRNCISPEERLIATLRFLATGRTYECLKKCTRISPQSLGRIIPETCKAIYEVLQEEYFKFPKNADDWKTIASQFATRWQFPNCGGAIDGKHIRVTRPPGTGALYYNYKHFYSIVMLAIVNADYEFVFMDVGKNGRNCDGAILEHTQFYQKLQSDQLNLPPQDENFEQLNYVFVGDDAFGLNKHILKPYGQHELTYQKRIFNYRVARARNVVENAFGIICSRFRVLNTTINISPQNIQYIIMAICTLHNFLCKRSRHYLQKMADSEDRRTHEIQKDAEWRNDGVELMGLQASRRRQCLEGKENRNEYLKYFNGKGSVHWQDQMLQKGKS